MINRYSQAAIRNKQKEIKTRKRNRIKDEIEFQTRKKNRRK